MKLGVLFSGGKDSYLAMHIASETHELSCLLTINSSNPNSWMFHTPTIEWTKLQSQSLKIPQIIQNTKGVQDKELDDLFELIDKGKNQFSIEGVVTGALASTYQSTRIQKICNDLNLWCFNPLWQMSQKTLLEELLENNIESIITGVAAEPFDDEWLGREIDLECINDLIKLKGSHRINPAGEGGEIESFVVNAPLFNSRLEIIKSKIHYSNYSGRLEIVEASLK